MHDPVKMRRNHWKLILATLGVLAVLGLFAFFVANRELTPRGELVEASSPRDSEAHGQGAAAASSATSVKASSTSPTNPNVGSRPELSALGLMNLDMDTAQLIERARLDGGFADALVGAVSLCGLLGDPKPNSKTGRFEDPRWRLYQEACTGFPREQLMIDGDLASWAQPGSPVWDLLGAAFELPEGDPERTALASDQLASSSDFQVLAQAALLFFDRQRILSPERERPSALRLGDDVGFRTELALLVACQYATGGCAWDSPLVLAECAGTASCYPGASLTQIVALRRSPQEMELLRALVAEVGRLRGST